jgi:hypothetical protein
VTEGCAEGPEFRFQKPDVATHHAEVGNLLSLNPKIHRLRADAKEDRCLPNSQRDFVSNGKGGLSAPAARFEGEALGIHTLLYGLL